MKDTQKTKSILLACTVIVLVSVLGAAIYVASRISAKTDRIQIPGGTAAAAEEPMDFRNILFLGSDREAGLCDVMMLINLNFTEDTVTVAQIPRDTYAAYTESSYKKLNGVYNSLGGAEAAADFLADAFGIPIHHYICIGTDTLCGIVDAVGGVDIDLPIDMHYSDPEQGLYIDFEAGVTHLDGKAAEKFIRFRSGYANGDLGRMDAQKLFMAAFFGKISSDMSPVMLTKLASAAEGVETDLSVPELMSLGVKALGVDAEKIFMLTLPGEQATATKSGASYYVLSAPAAEEIMERHFCSERDFDSERVFLNASYTHFERIYAGITEYSVLPIDRIISDKIKNSG